MRHPERFADPFNLAKQFFILEKEVVPADQYKRIPIELRQIFGELGLPQYTPTTFRREGITYHQYFFHNVIISISSEGFIFGISQYHNVKPHGILYVFALKNQVNIKCKKNAIAVPCAAPRAPFTLINQYVNAIFINPVKKVRYPRMCVFSASKI